MLVGMECDVDQAGQTRDVLRRHAEPNSCVGAGSGPVFVGALVKVDGEHGFGRLHND